MARPIGYEQNRHYGWELIDVIEGIAGVGLKVLPYNTLITEEYDYVKLNWVGGEVASINFKTGGAGGTTVATLTLGYVGGKLDSVTKT